MRGLDFYKPQREDKKQSKEETRHNGHQLCNEREMIINAFEENIFPLPKKEMPQYEKWSEEKKYAPLKEKYRQN